MPDGNHPAKPPVRTGMHKWPQFSKYVAMLDGVTIQPCPFCGDTRDGGSLLEYYLEACEPPVSYRYMCAHCCTEGPTKHDPREAIEAWNARAALTVDDLPRLTDEDREALDGGYVALEGVPSNEPLQPLDLVRKLESISSLELGRGVQALKQLVQLADEREGDSVPLDLLECVLLRLEDAEAAIDRLSADGLRAFRGSAEVDRA